jgi:hypothetical protein
MSGKKWLRRDLRQLSQALHKGGVDVSHVTVRRTTTTGYVICSLLLRSMDDTLVNPYRAKPWRTRPFTIIYQVFTDFRSSYRLSVIFV